MTIYVICYSFDEVQALNNKKLSLELGPMVDSSSFSKELLVPFLTLKCFLVGSLGVHFSLVFQISKPNFNFDTFFQVQEPPSPIQNYVQFHAHTPKKIQAQHVKHELPISQFW